MFIKTNNANVTIKERVWEDLRNQWNYISKEDTSSPTISTESLMLSLMIDAMKDQDVSTDEIPGAFLKTD